MPATAPKATILIKMPFSQSCRRTRTEQIFNKVIRPIRRDCATKALSTQVTNCGHNGWPDESVGDINNTKIYGRIETKSTGLSYRKMKLI